jgi:hypothetical protein
MELKYVKMNVKYPCHPIYFSTSNQQGVLVYQKFIHLFLF